MAELSVKIKYKSTSYVQSYLSAVGFFLAPCLLSPQSAMIRGHHKQLAERAKNLIYCHRLVAAV